MLIWSILLVLSSVVSLVQSQNGVLEQSFWPSAVPLAVRSPYFSCWLLTTEGRNLLAQWPRFWNYASSGSGDPFLTWQGLAKVDGTTYQWLGDWSDRPTPGINRVNLTGFRVTPTSTVFEMLAGPMSINVTFLTPIEPSDWVSQSIPFSYVSLEAASIDGSKHDFKVYADITAEWVSGNRSANVAWNTTVGNSVIYHEIFLSSPSQFEEIFGQADDGTMYHAVLNGLDVSYQTGLDEDCRGQFQNNSVLTNKQDTNFGNITGSSNSPVFAFAMDLGSISSTSAPVVWTLGYVRDPAIQYVTSSGQVQLRSPYFVTQYSSMADVISDFLINYTTTSQRAQALDSKIQQDALNISSEYADLVSLAARQVFGSIDITISKGSDGQWNTSDIMIFMKDMGNTRRINPVEVLYQAFPIFLYLNSSFGRPLLAPLLEYEDSSQFSLPYAAADLGNGYPVALGNNSGHSQGIEQSGNMLIMTLAHARASGDGYLIDRYYDLLKGWAKYLVNNTLEPTASQQSADQENVADSSNLAVKGIIGIQAMAEMSKAMGENDDETYFSQQVMTLIGEWESLALSSDQQHLLLDYGDESSWALVYNLYADRLLGTNLVNSSIYQKQTVFYGSLPRANFGLGIDSEHSSTGNSAWLLFAGAVAESDITQSLVSMAWSHASSNITPGIFPMTYDTSEGTLIGGSASPGQGAMFAPLALRIPNTTITIPSSPSVSSPSPTQSTTQSKSVNVGAIIGGVVGGLSIVACGILATLLLKRRIRKFLSIAEKDSPLVRPEPFTYNSVHNAPTFSTLGLGAPEMPTFVSPEFLSSSGLPFNSLPLASKTREVNLSRNTPQQPTSAVSAASGASSSQPASSREPPTSNSAMSATDVQDLRTEVEDLRRVVREIQSDRLEPPPEYVG